MVNYRCFSISDELFSGFKKQVDLDEINTLQDIINEVNDDLMALLKNNNLDSLENNLTKKAFHIHGYTFVDILQSDPNKLFYICSHCC